MKTNKILYWVFTGLICAWMLLQSAIFIFNPEVMIPVFDSLGFSTLWILPLGIAKILAVVAIIVNKSNLLKQLAYLGLAIEFIIALISHLKVSDNQWPAAAIALILLMGSYLFDRRLNVS